MDLEIPDGSEEFLNIGCYSDSDPTSFSPELGITTVEDTPPAVWVAGQWKAGGPFVMNLNGQFVRGQVARVLVGPTGSGTPIEYGGVGEYWAWSRFSDGTQTIIRNGGKFEVT